MCLPAAVLQILPGVQESGAANLGQAAAANAPVLVCVRVRGPQRGSCKFHLVVVGGPGGGWVNGCVTIMGG
jgi:hypothetical protein